MAQAMPTADQVLKVAASTVGYREGRDSNGNWNNRTMFTTWYAATVKQKAFLTSAWCAIWISWLFMKVGGLGTIVPLHAWTPAGLAWFFARKQVVGTPQRGDIVYYYYPSMKRVAHVGIVESVGGGWITTIEGNTNNTQSRQGNGVYRLRRRISSSMKFCRPAYGTGNTANTAQGGTATVPRPRPVPKPSQTKRAKQVGTVSVKNLKSAKDHDAKQSGTPLGEFADEVFTLETALARTQWMKTHRVDGHYGTDTVGDGSLGYGGVKGFQRKHSGTAKPDGWLGVKELKLLFDLANMQVEVKA